MGGSLNPATQALDMQAALAQTQVRKLPPAGKHSTDPEKARQTAQDFEAVFLSQMIAHMWTDLPTDGRFNGGFAENIWRKHMFQAMGDELAASGGVGLAEQVHGQILIGMGMPPEDALKIAADTARGDIKAHARANAEAVDNRDDVAIAAGRPDAPRLHPAVLDAQAAQDAAIPAAAAAQAYGAAAKRGE